MLIVWVLGASVAVSLLSLIGILTFLLNEKTLHAVLIYLVAFAAGGLIGAAFFHLLPESLAQHNGLATYVTLILGFILFFVMERYFFWRHCHDVECKVHPYTYLNIFGSSLHNFMDGVIIGASFLVSINFGLVATLAIVMHEIPHELGDFGILVYGGFSKTRALFYNFLTAVTAILGSVLGYFYGLAVSGFGQMVLPFAAGGFVYIACCDLIPELHKQEDSKRAAISMALFILGIGLMLAFKLLNLD